MRDITDLAAALTTRTGEKRLIQLTNESKTATTIDTDVLYAACADALGEFELHSGFVPVLSDTLHVSILIEGVLYKIEMYKGRDNNIVDRHRKNFISMAKTAREKSYIPAQTSSPLQRSTERTNSKPDMDKSLSVWKGGRYGSALSDRTGLYSDDEI